jgi:hypothetical protein
MWYIKAQIAVARWMRMHPYKKNGTGVVFQEGKSIAQVNYYFSRWRCPDDSPRSIAGKIEVPTELSLPLLKAWRDERPLILHMNDLEPSITFRLSMWDTWRTFTRFRIEGKTT